LDHDLGGEDTFWPVVEVLDWAAFGDRSFDIGVVCAHSADPAGFERIRQVFRQWGYHVHPVVGPRQVGYLERLKQHGRERTVAFIRSQGHFRLVAHLPLSRSILTRLDEGV